MNCPSCKNVVLSMSERHGIEIDYCPTCRGVWLDRGELDKIIEKTIAAEASSPAPTAQTAAPVAPPPVSGYAPDPRHDDYRYRDERDSKHYYKYKRRKSFLEELFD